MGVTRALPPRQDLPPPQQVRAIERFGTCTGRTWESSGCLGRQLEPPAGSSLGVPRTLHSNARETQLLLENGAKVALLGGVLTQPSKWPVNLSSLLSTIS